MPESSVHKFGEWIVQESWECLKGNIGGGLTATEQAVIFEQLVSDKLNQFCPEKVMRLGSQDKMFITAELKKISRQKNREYNKRGKSKKYIELEKLFKTKFKIELEKYLEKSLDALRDSKPGQAYNILKKMGAMPGDCIDANTFSLPNHEQENLSTEQCAERMADHFAAISQEFRKLDVNNLPARVKNKL